MRAVILAGGRGTRLAPYTTVIPKPLLPVGDKPILEIIFRQLAAAGFDHVTLSLGYMSVYFRTFLAQHQSLRKLMRIDFVEEEEPTGTAGSLATVPGLNGTFLVMNGDILTDLDYAAPGGVAPAERGGADHRCPPEAGEDRPGHPGDRRRGPGGRLRREADPALPGEHGHLRVRRFGAGAHPQGRIPRLPSLVLKLVAAGQQVNAWANDATWLDLGRHEDLLEATQMFGAGRHGFLPREAA